MEQTMKIQLAITPDEPAPAEIRAGKGNLMASTSEPETVSGGPAVPADLQSIRENHGRLRELARRHVAARKLIPPLPLHQLEAEASRLMENEQLAEDFRDLLMVLISNAIWEDEVSRVPFGRRLFLLPQCLRRRDDCPAEMDRWGLMCVNCGGCDIGPLIEEAEQLGYLTLVAEGTTVVTRLLEAEQIDAVIGISCLAGLERSFPYQAAAALPGIGLPLLRSGCDDTAVDTAGVREALHLNSGRPFIERTGFSSLKNLTAEWFDPEPLRRMLQAEGDPVTTLAMEWMNSGGKRWRPLLCAGACDALTAGELPACLPSLAVAVECFHKASLVHDDIEDGDLIRYGKPTLQARHGLAPALNTGDFLIGEGYRLIAGCGAPAGMTARMLAIAAKGHRDLCLGQGAELDWREKPYPVTVQQVLDIFRLKTAPAFAVALGLGAVAAGAGSETLSMLNRFSEALGIAYQILDDLDDFAGGDDGGEEGKPRLSILLALAMEARPELRKAFACACQSGFSAGWKDQLRQAVRAPGVRETAAGLLQTYRRSAYDALQELPEVRLKGWLFRLVHAMLGKSGPPASQTAPAIKSPDGSESGGETADGSEERCPEVHHA